MENNIQNRFKSPVLWCSMISLIGLILGNYNLYEQIGLTSESFQNIANAILTTLTALGLLNNPTDSEKF